MAVGCAQTAEPWRCPPLYHAPTRSHTSSSALHSPLRPPPLCAADGCQLTFPLRSRCPQADRRTRTRDDMKAETERGWTSTSAPLTPDSVHALTLPSPLHLLPMSHPLTSSSPPHHWRCHSPSLTLPSPLVQASQTQTSRTLSWSPSPLRPRAAQVHHRASTNPCALPHPTRVQRSRRTCCPLRCRSTLYSRSDGRAHTRIDLSTPLHLALTSPAQLCMCCAPRLWHVCRRT